MPRHKITQGHTHLHYDSGHTQTNLLDPKFCPPLCAIRDVRKVFPLTLDSLDRCA